jgi:hypothetical protein
MRPSQGSPILAQDLCAVCAIAVAQRQPTLALAQPFKAGLLCQCSCQCFQCGRSGNALDLWAMATKQPTYEAAVDLCSRLHLTVPYSPMSDVNGDREEEPAPSLSTSTVQ